MLRDGGKDQRRGQRDMQEKTHALATAHGAQFRSKRDQVVVVDPDHIIRAQQRRELARKELVDAAIDVEIAGVEIRQVDAIVEHRPQHAVAVALVVRVVVLAAQVDRGQRDIAGLLDMQLPLARRAALRGFHDLAAPAKPHAAGSLERFAQCHGEAARGDVARIGDAVGYRY